MAHAKLTLQQAHLVRNFAADLAAYGDRITGVSDLTLARELGARQLRNGKCENKLAVLAFHWDHVGNYTVLLPNGNVRQLAYEEL